MNHALSTLETLGRNPPMLAIVAVAAVGAAWGVVLLVTRRPHR